MFVIHINIIGILALLRIINDLSLLSNHNVQYALRLV